MPTTEERRQGIPGELLELQGSRRRPIAIVLSLALVVFVVAAVLLSGVDRQMESAVLLTAFNTLFGAAVSLGVTFLAARTFVATGEPSVFLLGCGAFTYGAISMVAGPLISDLPVALAVFDLGALVSGGFYVAAGALLGAQPWEEGGRAVRIAAACAGILLLLGIAIAAAEAGLLPAFWEPGQGTTRVHTVVLATAAVLFLAAGGLYARSSASQGSRSALWLAAGLGMIGIGLAIVAIPMPWTGTALNWLGRAIQYGGSLCLLTAMVVAVEETGAFAGPLQAAYRRLEERSRLALEASETGIYEWDLRTGALSWDRQLRRQWGVSEDVPESYAVFLEGVHPDDRDRVERQIEESLDPAGDGELETEYRVIGRDDGVERWILTVGRTDFADDTPVRMAGITLDVTERKATEEQLREQAELTEELSEIQRLLHAALDSEEVFTEVLARARAQLGCSSTVLLLREDEEWIAEHGVGLPESMLGRRLGRADVPLAAQTYDEAGPTILPTFSPTPSQRRTWGLGEVAAGYFLPLLIQRKTPGVLAFIWRDSSALLSKSQLEFGRELATNLSLALENIRLYEEQRRIATSLQQQFIHPLPEVAGLELSALSRPASHPQLIGGDFHDAFLLPDDSLAVVVGDVQGKGIRAAGLSETVRAAIRALTVVSPSPRYVLENVNRLLLQQGDDQYVTALVMVLDVASGSARIASAGHPPPVRLCDGAADPLALRTGPALGLLAADYPSTHFHVRPGDRLLLYTDGLTEARAAGEQFGVARVLRTVEHAAGREPAAVLEELRDAVEEFADDLRDDMDMVLVGVPEVSERAIPGQVPRLSLAIPLVPWQLAAVRGALRDFLLANGVEQTDVEDVLLFVGEAVMNAIEHSGTQEPAHLRVALRDDHVEAVLQDFGIGLDTDDPDRCDEADLLRPRGRGLVLMRGLVDHLDISDACGTRICFRKRL